MSWSMPRRHQHFAECESVAIFDFLGRKAVLRAAFAAGINLRRVQPRAKLARTAHQVGMNMRFKNVRDSHARFTCRLDVNIAVRARIKYRCDSFVIVAHEIRKLGDPFRLNGFKNERHCGQSNAKQLQTSIRSTTTARAKRKSRERTRLACWIRRRAETHFSFDSDRGEDLEAVGKVREPETGFASTRDACATQKRYRTSTSTGKRWLIM